MPRSVGELRDEARRLVLGMLVAQAAALAATPVLTRLYGPEHFGVYGVFLAVIGALAPISSLRIDAALPLAVDDREASALVRLGLLTAALLAAVAALLLSLGLGSFGGRSVGAVAIAWWWLPVALWLTGAFQLGAAWWVRRAEAGRSALGRASQGVGTALTQAMLGVVGSLPTGLLAGDVTGRALATAVVLPDAIRSRGVAMRLRDVAVRYRGFATLASAAALVNSFNAAVPVLTVGAMAGPAVAGLLVLAQRVASLPATLFSSAVSQVFTVELVRASTGSARVALFDAVLRQVLRSAVWPAVAIAVLAPVVFAPIFGEAWREAGLVTTVLAPFYLLQTCSASTIATVDVLSLHAQRLVRELVFVVGASVVLVGSLRAGWTLPAIALAFSVFGSMYYLGSLWWVRRLLVRAETQ